MYLETERLILRAPQEQDAQDYMEFCNSEFVLRYNAMTPKNTEQVLHKLLQKQDDCLFIVLKDSGKVIGEICIEDDSIRWGIASRELSYFISEAYSRKGYMKEALRVVIDYLFETEKLECVAARVFAQNIASLALLQSLGFHQDGYIPRCVKGYGDVIFDDTLHSLFHKND